MTSIRNRALRQFGFNAACAPIAAVLIFLFSSATVTADEICINEDSSETVAGDFRCKPCYRTIINDSDSFVMGKSALTTGDLYRYFESRGITTIDRLSLHVDVDCCSEQDEAFQLERLDFKITGSDDKILNQASLQNDSVLVASTEISSYKPEAILEFDLGYNFMERFTSESTDTIELNYVMPVTGTTMTPRFVVSEDISSFSLSNILIMALFVSFWVAVFAAMNVLVKPTDEPARPKATSRSVDSVHLNVSS